VPNTKVIIAGVAFAAAVAIFFLRGSGEEAVPNTDDTRTQWVCLACQKPFTLTASEYESAAVKSNNTGLLHCPACSELKGVRAATCGLCQEMFATMDAEGNPAQCLKCNPVVVKAQNAPEAEQPAAEAAPVEEEAPAPKPVIFAE